ncbi:SGNH/GDSL hydrolase family protein [Desulfosarcina sp.]|nr:SGNH/GDSL hydrolase family protein [Desulfosarcina sp.]
MKKNIFIFLLIFSSVFVYSCNQDDKINTMPTETSNELKQYSYLALGDSYTIGQSVGVEERWPAQLVESLFRSGYNVAPLKIIAQTGWTTDELKEAILSEDLQETYDLVTLLIGVNNQYRNLDTLEYRTEFEELLQMAVSFAGNNVKNVVVVSIPDYGVTPFGQARDPIKIAKEIDEFNQINYEETIKAGVTYVNITPISREAENNPELIAEDGLHPSGVMYGEWVKLILPEVKLIFDNQIIDPR